MKILGDGSLITCSEKDRELFWGIPGAYGSLGIVVGVTLNVVSATRYVHLRYIRCDHWKEAEAVLRSESFALTKRNAIKEKSLHYLDALMMEDSSVMIIAGQKVDEIDNLEVRNLTHSQKMYDPSSYHSPLHYQHIQQISFPFTHYIHSSQTRLDQIDS